MRGDQIIQTQLLMAQAFGGLADAITNSTGYAFTPVAFDTLVADPGPGSVACISDSAVTTGAISAGGGSNRVRQALVDKMP
jgi:hypothetical protein